MRHFWSWVKNADETRTLFLEGVIAEESWFSDEVTPAMFKEELFAGNGPILLHINSPGGDCIAASQIYTIEYCIQEEKYIKLQMKISHSKQKQKIIVQDA